MVDYQRNRRPPVLVVIQGEKMKKVDSYKYLEVQIIKKKNPGHYDVIVKLNFGLLGKKCHYFIILSF